MSTINELRTVNVIRYVMPLREGGSLPAIAEADDEFLYVLKFRGAGQGVRALIADLIGGEIARALGFKIPELVLANLDSAFGRTEPDEEIQELLRWSEGMNLGVHYLAGAISFDPAVHAVTPLQASQIVWLDALLTNVDRTVRNTNMLNWKKELWLIDHGAALYFHHTGGDWKAHAVKPFNAIKDHVLLAQASVIEQANEQFTAVLTPECIKAIAALIPADWLQDNNFDVNAETMRNIYEQYLNTRIKAAAIFVNEAQYARATLI
ncbi:MAG: aminotransferase class I and II [Bacteroidetes bacterium]|nr:aminotransferase class I and II [Bacteroidota bacterium]